MSFKSTERVETSFLNKKHILIVVDTFHILSENRIQDPCNISEGPICARFLLSPNSHRDYDGGTLFLNLTKIFSRMSDVLHYLI